MILNIKQKAQVLCKVTEVQGPAFNDTVKTSIAMLSNPNRILYIVVQWNKIHGNVVFRVELEQTTRVSTAIHRPSEKMLNLKKAVFQPRSPQKYEAH